MRGQRRAMRAPEEIGDAGLVRGHHDQIRAGLVDRLEQRLVDIDRRIVRRVALGRALARPPGGEGFEFLGELFGVMRDLRGRLGRDRNIHDLGAEALCEFLADGQGFVELLKVRQVHGDHDP
eukprot:m.261663 g.261663  ORF g.261663 m.261663 type:complete len:122 (-) comp45797_c0_seq1:58-423(-)